MQKVETLLGVDEAARLCRVSEDAVRRWMGLGLRFAAEDGAPPLIHRADLGAFLKDHGIWAPPELSAQKPLRVLVVEDEADMRRMVERLVRRLHPEAHVYGAADGFEAGQKVMSLHPDVVVVDLHLPGLDGVKVCRSLRSYSMLKDTKIVAISGDKDPALRERALREGADVFLAKPFYPRDLEAVLEPLVAGR